MLTFPVPSSGGGGGGSGPNLSNATPLVESGAGSAGTGADASRNDHVHPAAPVTSQVNARFAPTAALPAYTISGVGGSTLTLNATGVLAAQDGVTPALNDLFYYDKDTAHAGVDNGLWKITTLGAVGVALVAIRVAPLAAGSSAKGVQVAIFRGTTRQGEAWVCTNDNGSDTVGTNALTFVDYAIYGNQGTATPAAIANAGVVGISNKYAREDHAHAYTRSSASFSGAGPYAIANAPTDRVVMNPSSNNTVVANLPSIANASVVDGFPIVFTNVGTIGEQIVLQANGSDTVGGEKYIRVFGGVSPFPNGSVTLAANKATNSWVILNEVKGAPLNYTVFVNNATGNDANPGTAAAPLQSLVRAVRLMDVGWVGTGIIDIAAGSYGGSTLLIPGPRAGTSGAALSFQGPAAQQNALAGVTTVTITAGGSAATTSAFRKVVFASNANLDSNAAMFYFFKGLSGTLNNSFVPIKASTATNLELISNGSAVTSGTFSVLTPSVILENFAIKAAGGTDVQLSNVDLGNFDSGATADFYGLNVTLSRVRLCSNTFTNCITSTTSCVIAGTVLNIVSGRFGAQNVAFLSPIQMSDGAEVSLFTIGGDDTFAFGLFPQIVIAGVQPCSLTINGIKFTDAPFQLTMPHGELILTTGNFDSPNNFITTVPFIFSQVSAQIKGLTGNIGSGVTEAITAKDSSQIIVNSATTINAAGAANAVRVGANGVKSWATIAGDAIANTFDGAVAGGSGVSVRVAL